jgi:hypothetical protein
LIVAELREVSQASGSGSSAADSSVGERQGRQPDPEESSEALAGPDTPADSQEPLPNPRHEYSTGLISGRWRGIAEDDFHDEDGYGGDSQPEEPT